MSSNSKSNIEKVLAKNNMGQFFEGIYSDSSIFGKHKTLAKLYANYKI